MAHPAPAILELWVTFRASAFPEACTGQQLLGVDLLALDGQVTGCVGRYVAQGCVLDQNDTLRLRSCVEAFRRILPLLPTEAVPHFERMRAVAHAVYLELHATQ